MDGILDLNVSEALAEGVGKGLARLDPEDIKAINAVLGDVIEIAFVCRTAAMLAISELIREPGERRPETFAMTAGHCQDDIRIVRDRSFWWAYGATIGGSNLRDLVRKAIHNQPLEMVPDAGGAFLTMADLARAVELSLSSPAAAGRVYNVGSLFMTWKEIGEIIVSLTGSTSEVKQIPSGNWRGPAFLNEVWDLDWSLARQEMGYEPAETADAMKAAFREALAGCVAQVRAEGKAS